MHDTIIVCVHGLVFFLFFPLFEYMFADITIPFTVPRI